MRMHMRRADMVQIMNADVAASNAEYLSANGQNMADFNFIKLP
jgi:hypothetical protein